MATVWLTVRTGARRDPAGLHEMMVRLGGGTKRVAGEAAAVGEAAVAAATVDAEAAAVEATVEAEEASGEGPAMEDRRGPTTKLLAELIEIFFLLYFSMLWSYCYENNKNSFKNYVLKM